MRYAAYMRASTDALALDLQRQAIEAWVAARKGQLVQVYVDEGQSGQGVARPALQRLLQDASQDAFDALVVHRLDRLGRSQVDVQAQLGAIDTCAVSDQEGYA
ncbi:MAG: recombinase family protein [Rhodocyclaceae bacterium]|nr:recombinase family protein [Rhodocyclaceae bacterium]